MAFVSTWGLQVFSYSLDTSTLKEFKQFQKLLVKPKIMCMAHHEQNLYVIGDQEGETDKVLLRVDYNDTEVDIVYKGPELSDVWRMDFFNGTIVWTNYEAKLLKDVAYKCTLTPKCLKQDINIIFVSKENQV